MRTTQFRGHTEMVENFLKHCQKKEKIGEVLGMCDEHVCDLFRYEDNRGNLWDEVVQAEPWSAGPVIFLGIQSNGYFDGWGESDILNA